ncbi:PQQ-binding-like beta-propeller repeat protein [Amycolatopsis anabasis]|uniref:Rv3212 family protein n=1 Tax=Amycolatopsis anabasis TaxID=1840409 RepID=UPI00131D296A|nr:PQQ-binding-like beta-propeller repeat protein [Amycolatopsis anabasis]
MSEPVEGGRHRRPAGEDIGAEDVLPVPVEGGGAPRHAVEPVARRSPWNRRGDRVAAAMIVVVCVVAGVLIWAGSDHRATVSETANAAAELPPAPDAVPGSLTQVWQAPSGATTAPVTEGTSVVTGSGGEVDGRDPVTGQIRWRYARDIPLCTIGGAWSRVNAVYRKEIGCSEVTQLDPSTGHRTAQRNGDAELGTRLLSDGSHVTATGQRLLNTWRDDLVKSMEYGQVPALVNPEKQPRTGCTYGSVAVSSGKVGVIERCPGDLADRFTVYKSTGDKEDEPKVLFSALLAGRSAKLVAMSGDSAAIALPEQQLLVLYGADGNQRAAYPLTIPAADLAQDPPGGVLPTTTTANNVYWFTGSKTMALAKSDLTPLWTLDGTLGPGVLFAKQLVVPIKGGLAVLDEQTGTTIRTIGVDRHGYQGPVRLGALGPMLFEQRGDTLAALR